MADERKAHVTQKSVELRGTLQVGQGAVRPLRHMYAICPYGDTTKIDIAFVGDGKNIGLTVSREYALRLIERIKSELARGTESDCET